MATKEQLRLAGIKRHGSEKLWREFLAKSGAKASRPGTGGFAHMKKHDKDKLRSISILAANKRWRHGKAKDGITAKKDS